MNTRFNTLVLLACILLGILISCESHEESADDAFEQIRQEKMMSKGSKIISKKLIPKPQQKELIGKIQLKQDEWTTFRLSMEQKIAANEIKVNEMKVQPKISSRSLRKIGELEKENTALKVLLEDYQKKTKEMLENFKLAMNRDLAAIDTALRVLGASK